jgi:hypothetical protein
MGIKKWRGRKALFFVLAVCVVAAVLVWFRSYVFTDVAANLNARIDSLKVSGLIITYDTLIVDWRKNAFELRQVVVEKNAYDTTCTYPEFVKIERVRAQGLRLLPLLFEHALSFESVLLEGPHVVMRPNSLFRADPATRKKNPFSFRADNITMKSAHLAYLDSAECETRLGMKGDLSLQDLTLNFTSGKPLEWDMATMTFDSIQLRLGHSSSTYEVLQAKVDFAKGLLDVDTIRLLPDYGKLEYGRKFGYEIDRIEGIIPFVRLAGIDFSDSSAVSTRSADVQFFLKIFRDKRLPFKRETKLLPTTLLRDLPFHLRIDTLTVVKSFVQYEELENGADAPGKIYFDDVEATFSNVNNRSNAEGIKLEARALLLGQGKITISAVFAVAETKRSALWGSLRHFSLPKINSMMTPTTNLKIESGTMDELSFNFTYNAQVSNGEVELKYRDLKLVTYKEGERTEDGAPAKDKLKTFLMNLFVFKKKMDEKMPEENRTGTIHYARDDSRSVFNFWFKSVLSGIRSACDLDKMEDKKTKREVKKEERLTKREMRKQKKAAKDKEQG